jgi:hypothetical protein
MFVATAFFFVGVAIAVWVFFSAFLLPLGKGLIHVASSSQLRLLPALFGPTQSVVVVPVDGDCNQFRPTPCKR